MSEKMDNKHVVPRPNGWGVIDAGGRRASKVFVTKGEATEYAKDLAKKHKVMMVIHDEDGKFDRFDVRPEVQDQHVVKKGKRWAVVEEGGEHISQMFDRKGAAMAHAYNIATKHDVCMRIHDKDGKFESTTCGPDDNPGVLQVIRMGLKI